MLLLHSLSLTSRDPLAVTYVNERTHVMSWSKFYYRQIFYSF